MKQKFFGKVGQQGKLFTGREVEGLVKNAILNEQVSLANEYVDLAFRYGENQGFHDGYKKGYFLRQD